jgi:predicted DNA-binding transcriptional regulator YafY
MENTIVLTMKEQRRVEVMQRVFRAEMTMAEAALVLGVTERQSYRIKAKIREEGVKGVIHGNRGRRCCWKVSEDREKDCRASEGVLGSTITI